MNRVRAVIALIISLAALLGYATSDWKLALAITGVAIAVGAEIDISLHRRDHNRRHKTRRSEDQK